MGITHKWEGTTLIVSSDSGTSSCDLKGDKGETGVRGPQGKPGVVSNSEGVNIDLSDYALKSEMPTNVSQLTNDRGYLTSVPSEYITETELNNKNYLTSVPSEYITETELNAKGYLTKHQDLSGYAQMRDLPTKTSQLVNDSGYIKASELETGEANWNSIKDYLLEPMEVAITWDGNTTGREVYEMKGSITGTFYKVSDIVVKAEDIVGCTYYTKVGGDTENTVPARGTGVLFGLYDNDYSWILIAAGMVCLYDDSQGCSPGLYFNVGPYEYDNSKTQFVTKLIVEHDKIKTELLPENIGGGTVDMSKYFETVGGDTLTWDGNTEGKYFLSEASCHVSNFAPPLDELKKGGFFTFSLGATTEDVAFTSNDIMSADEMGFGSGLTLVTENGNPYIIIVHTPNAKASLDGMTLPANVPVGTYFYYGADDDYVKSLTINDYSFKKEVIKEECLPPMGGTVKSIVFTSATELYNWLENNDTNKVLRVSVYSGLYLEGKTMVFYGVTPMSDGDTYYLERIALYTFDANSVSSGYQFIAINKGGILNLNSGTFTFNTNGTLSCTRDEPLQLNDEAIQYIGANITITYAD